MDINPLSIWHNPQFVLDYGGYLPKDCKSTRKIRHVCEYDIVRRDMIILLLKRTIENNIQGDIAELGVYQGHTARLIHHYAPERHLHLFDTFTGFCKEDLSKEVSYIQDSQTTDCFSDTSVDNVTKLIRPLNKNVHFYPGYFPNTVPGSLDNVHFSFVHLDADLYKPMIDGLNFFYPQMSHGGIIVCHDYNSWPGSRRAVDEFCSLNNQIPLPMPDKCGSAVIIKS